MLLDTLRVLETPEGVDLELRVAGPLVRCVAWALDFAIRVAIYIALSIALSVLGKLGTGILLASLFALEWLYPVFFELHNGQTPGKKAMGLRVVHGNGTPVGWSASLIRNLLRAADFLPFLYGFGLVSMLANRNFQRLGDLAANTLVVYDDVNEADNTLLDQTPSDPPLRHLSMDEQKTLIEFAERVEKLSPARVAELAQLLPSLTQDSKYDAVETLQRNAAWLITGK
jgi:uncharacterized RDD family membrane protein YckC